MKASEVSWMLTFREKLESECPEDVNESYVGGAMGCPRAWGYESERPCMEMEISCWECWNRKMRGKVMTNERTTV